MSKQDYQRAASLLALTRDKLFLNAVHAYWLDNGRFCYRVKTSPSSHEQWIVDVHTGRKSPCPLDLFLSLSPKLPVLRPGGVLCSGHDATETEILFKNDLDEPVCVFWIDWEGEERKYTVLGSGDAYGQHTYATHAWVVKTLDDQQPICAFRAIEIPAVAPIKDIQASMAASLLPVLLPKPELRSVNGGEETEILLKNNLSERVRVFLIDSEGKKTEHMVLGSGETRLQQTYAGHAWLITSFVGQMPICAFVASEVPSTASIKDLGTRAPSMAAKLPIKSWTAFIKDGNLGLKRTHFLKAEVIMLTKHASNVCKYKEEDLHWSPDGKKLVAMQTAYPTSERYIHLIESSPGDQEEPKLHKILYPKPGDSLPQQCPHLFDADTHKQILVPDSLFANSFGLSKAHWEEDSSRFMVVYNQRGHQVLRVIAIDAVTGDTKVIVEEKSKTFIDYVGKMFIHYLDKTKELLWMSERDGWNHLYLYDTQKGMVKNQVTNGAWVVRGVERVDESKRVVHFKASGIYPRQDPYHIHYCRVNFDGTGLLVLTRGDGTHSVDFSPCDRYLIDTYSRVDLPPVIELRNAGDGLLLTSLEVCDLSALQATDWKMPMRFVAKGRDGCTDIYGVIFRPTNLNPHKLYPIIEEINAGPQKSHVPKSFSVYHEAQYLAELGFIVVVIDGMGTSNRSKAFHDVCAKNLGDAGLPDRILWIQAAAKKFPYMDIRKVGIYGVSVGGQNALHALLTYPNFYNVGVAASGSHDNRMDKLWRNELWMGWPVGPHYDLQSNVRQAHLLAGKLLLIVCELDTDVDPASTYKMVNAITRSNKDFELVVIPGEEHGLGGPYGKRKMVDFFVRHLLEVNPLHK